MTVVVGDATCASGTMGGEIFDRWDALIAALPEPPSAEALAAIVPGVKRLFHSVAHGVVAELLDGIGDGLYLRRVGSDLVGASPAPASHASTHENGGGDELDVTGLSGLLADPQTPAAHAATHGLGAGDELDVTALGGYSGNAAEVLSGAATWITVGASAPEDSLAYEVIEIDTTLAIVSGVGQVLVTSSVLPEGWAGSAFWEYTGSGGTLAFPHTGYSRSGRARMTRASGGSLVVTSVGASTAGSVTFSYSALSVGNAIQISVTISNTSNWRFRGWLRLYGQVVPV